MIGFSNASLEKTIIDPRNAAPYVAWMLKLYVPFQTLESVGSSAIAPTFVTL